MRIDEEGSEFPRDHDANGKRTGEVSDVRVAESSGAAPVRANGPLPL
jgi:hypothetical protein